MPAPSTIHASLIQRLLARLDREGAPSLRLLEQSGMSPSIVTLDPTTSIDEEPLWTLLDLSAREMGPGFGLTAGREGLLALGLLGKRIRQALTLRNALVTLIEGIRTFSNKADFWIEGDEGGIWLLRNADLLAANPGAPEAEFYVIATLESIVQLVVDEPWRSERVRLRHATPEGAFHHPDRARNGHRHTAVFVPARLLDRPLRTLIEPERRTEGARLKDVRRLATERLGAGEALTLGRAAAAISTSERTLKRRLADEGLTYRKLLAQVRFAEYLRLLRSPHLQIRDVAHRVGYPDPANFTRAFHGWTGTTPSLYRESLR